MSATNGRVASPSSVPLDGTTRPTSSVPERPTTPRAALPAPWYSHLRASALILVLILVTGCIAVPLAVVGFAEVFAPSTAAGQPYAGQNQTNSSAVNNSPPPVASGHVLPSVHASPALAPAAGRHPGSLPPRSGAR